MTRANIHNPCSVVRIYNVMSFGIPNESTIHTLIGWTRLTDRYGFVPPKVAGPETKINVRQLNKEITKNNRTLAGLLW